MTNVELHDFIKNKKSEIAFINNEILQAKLAQFSKDTDSYGNMVAEHGCTRCACGNKYWEFDKCTSCGYIIK